MKSYSHSLVIPLLGLTCTGAVLFNPSYAVSGELDVTFGMGGMALTDFGGNGQANALALQPDGKIVVAGQAFAGRTAVDRDFALARYNRDGSLDAEFGDNGKVTTDFFDGSLDEAHAVAVQEDDKIVLAGRAKTSAGDDFALARYNRDGSLDTDFGRSGRVSTDFAGGVDQAAAIAVQADGKIVVAGSASALSVAALARYNRDGSLDGDFGDSGKVTTDFGSDSGRGNALALQPDGKIVLAGASFRSATHSDFALARFDVDGSPDRAFGDNGTVIIDIAGDLDMLNALALQPDGKIVAAGFTGDQFSDFALTRLDGDGNLDSGFGDGGKITIDFFGRADNAHGLALQPNGKIVVTGSAFRFGSGSQFALTRYHDDGSLDTDFGNNGKLVTEFFDGEGATAAAHAVTLQPDGKIIAAGLAEDSGANKDFALARYLGEREQPMETVDNAAPGLACGYC